MGPAGTAANLAPDWRRSLPAKLAELAERWDKSEAWTGMTTVGGQQAPAEVIGVITFGELSVHGWDLPQGTGIAFEPDPAGLAALHELTSATFAGPNGDAMRGTAFGAPITVADDEGIFEQTLGVLGRDPHSKP